MPIMPVIQCNIREQPGRHHVKGGKHLPEYERDPDA